VDSHRYVPRLFYLIQILSVANQWEYSSGWICVRT